MRDPSQLLTLPRCTQCEISNNPDRSRINYVQPIFGCNIPYLQSTTLYQRKFRTDHAISSLCLI